LHLGPSAQTDSPALDLLPALLTVAALRSLDIPERQRFNPWLLACALVMIYGPRGVGKTQLALGLALSLAAGIAFLTWKTPKSVGVLYVDGEMSLDDLRQRVQAQAGDHMPTNLFFLTGEMVYHTLDRDLVLTREECRTAIVQILDAHPEIKVVILDNVSCLFSGISEDRKQDWEPINAWLVRLRHRGLSVILIHHAGKTGQQRGTSGREDALDTVIALNWPPNYDPREGCRFHLRFTKSRSVKGDAVTPLEVKLEDSGNTTEWKAQPLEQSRLEQVCQLLAQGVTRVTDIAVELEIS
jgi:predicted ATP-dependent serine protease